MHRITGAKSFDEILTTFRDTGKDHDPHLRLKETGDGATQILYAHEKGSIKRNDPKKTFARRQDATNFVMDAFRAQYAHEPRCRDRVLNHIDKDERRFEKVGGNFILKASNVRLMGELMTNELDRTAVVKDQWAIYSQAYGHDVVQKAAKLILEGDPESGLAVPFIPLNRMSPEDKTSPDDLRAAFKSALDIQITRSAAEALTDPLVHNMFSSVAAFKEAASKHCDIILSDGIVDHRKIQNLKPWLAFYPVLDALSHVPSARDLGNFPERLALGAHCLLPDDKASSFAGIREPSVDRPAGMTIVQFNRLQTAARIHSAATLVGKLLLESVDQFHLPKERKDDVLLLLEKPEDILDNFDKLTSILDEPLTASLNQLSQAPERHRILGAKRSRSPSQKLAAPKLKQSVPLNPSSSQDGEKIGRVVKSDESDKSDTDEWNDWDSKPPEDSTDSDKSSSISSHSHLRRLDPDSDESSKLKTEKKKRAHLDKLDVLTRMEVKTPKGAPSSRPRGLKREARLAPSPPRQMKKIILPESDRIFNLSSEKEKHEYKTNASKSKKTSGPKGPDEWMSPRPEKPPVRLHQLNPLEAALSKSTNDQAIAWAQNQRDKMAELKERAHM